MPASRAHRQRRRPRAVGEDADDARRRRARPRSARSSSARRLLPRPDASTTIPEISHAPTRSRAACSAEAHALAAVARDHCADRPVRQAEGVERSARPRRRRPARSTSTKPMPQLKVRHISSRGTAPSRCSQSNTGGSADRRGVDVEAEAVGDDADDVLGQAAAGDVRHRVDRRAAASSSSIGLT